MYQAMAHCMKDVVGSDLVEEGNSLSGATANASGELRNFLFHGQPFILALTSGEHEIWAKFAARKGGVQARIVGLTPKYIDAQTATVKEIIERWQSIRERSFKELAIWDRMPADLREDGGDEGS
jgi:hypothetical protein